MFALLRPRRASALLISVIVIVVLVGLSGSYLAITTAHSQAVSEEVARDQALEVAEGAIDRWIQVVEDFRAAHKGAPAGSPFVGVFGVSPTTGAPPKPPGTTSPSLLSKDPAGEWAAMNSMANAKAPWGMTDASGQSVGSATVVPTDWATDGADNDGDGLVDGADSTETGQFTLLGTATSSGTTVQIEVTIGPRPDSPFLVGLFGDKKMKIDKDGLTDSYDSHPGGDFSAAPTLYDVATAGDKGNVGSNGRMKVKKDTQVNGFVKSSGVREWKPGSKAPFNKKLIDIDKDVFVQGDIEAGHGEIRLKKEVTVEGNVGTSDGNVKIDRDSLIQGDVDTANGDITLKDGVHVTGHASPGPGMEAKLSKDVVVDGGVFESAFGPDVPEIVFPPAPSGDGVNMTLFTLATATSNNNPTVTVMKGKKATTTTITTLDITSGTYTLPPGNYFFDQVKVAKGASLVFSGNTNLVVTGDLTLADGGAMRVQGDASIAVGSKLDAQHDSTFVVDGNTRVAVTGDLKLRGTANFGVSASNTTTIDVLKHFEIKHDADVHFRGPTVLETEDRFRTDHHANVLFGDRVTVFAENELEMKHANIDQLPDATKAFFFAGSSTSKDGKVKVKIEIPSGKDFFGTVYAPKAKLEVKRHHFDPKLAGHVHVDAEDDKKDLEDDKEDGDDDLDDDKKDGKGDGDDDFEEDDDPVKSDKKKKEEDEELKHAADPQFANFMGAVIGWDVKMKKGIRFHYDESLGKLLAVPSSDEVVVLGWRRVFDR